MIDGHVELKDISPDNYRLLSDPDRDFNRQRNYAVLKKCIEDNRKQRGMVDPKVKASAGNVGDILASWAKYKLDKDGGKKLEQWLGKHWMTKIYGEKLIEKIKMGEALAKLNRSKGNTMFGGNFYLK